jgi:hypothetical protein
MKNKALIYFLSLAMVGLLLSCQKHHCHNEVQDENETGIDCGGDCEPCNATGSPNYSAADLAGLWYVKADDNSHGYPGACSFVHILTIFGSTIQSNSSCKAQLTLEPTYEGSPLYKSIGMLGGCGYPFEHFWSFNPGENTLDGHSIVSLTNNELVLSNPHWIQRKYHSRTPINITDYYEVQWKVEILEYKITENDTAKLRIGYHNGSGGGQNIIVLSPGSNVYEGVAQITREPNKEWCDHEFSIEINAYAWNTDYIVYRTTIQVNDLISKTGVKTNYFNSQINNTRHWVILK